MTRQRAAAEVLSDLRTRVRVEINDSDSSNYRWSNTQVNRAISDSLRFLLKRRTGTDPGEALITVSFTYAAGEASVFLPAPLRTTPFDVLSVDDFTESTIPVPLDRVPWTVIESVRGDVWGSSSYVWAITADENGRRIAVRGTPGADLSLRATYLAPPFDVTDDGDTIPLEPDWYRLLVLRAAKDLRAVEDEWRRQQEENLREQMELFTNHANQNTGVRVIPTRRRH